MATQEIKTNNLLYLDQITLQDGPNSNYKLRLFVDDKKVELQRTQKDNHTWAPVRRPGISPASKPQIQIESGHLWQKEQTTEPIDLQKLFDDYWNSTTHELTISRDLIVRKYNWSLELQFSANTTVASLRSSLWELEELLEEYTPLMKGSTEAVLDKGIKFAVVLSEMNPFAKAAFSVASLTFELLKEQNKYDQTLSDLFD